MKKLLITTLLLTQQAAYSFYDGPIVSKSSHSGYTSMEFRRGEKCEIFHDRVVLSHIYGNAKIVETRTIKAEGLQFLVQQAKSVKVNEGDNFLCDGPSTAITAYQVMPNDTVEEVQLFRTGGCGQNWKERPGFASTNLQEMIGKYCPTTHKPYNFPRDTENP